MRSKEAPHSIEFHSSNDAASHAKSVRKGSSDFDVLPGTVATCGMGSFNGYSGAANPVAVRRGNVDIDHRRFFDTMASYYRLQDSVDRAVMEEQVERIRKGASMDYGEQSLTNDRHVDTNVPTPPDSTGEKDFDLLATALKELLTSDEAQRRIGPVHAGSPAVGGRVLSDDDLKKLL